MSNLSIGEKIKKYRMMAGYTQAELAWELGRREEKKLAPSAIAGYESGQRVPKIESRVQMARILNVDPISLSGIELDELDEKRLLCKLLAKYASDILLEDDCSVTAKLSSDFASFQMEYEDYKEELEEYEECLPKDSLRYELQAKALAAELEHWMERYPRYDAVHVIKGRNENFTLEDILKEREWRKMKSQDEFFRYQDDYWTPMMNKEIIERIRNN